MASIETRCILVFLTVVAKRGQGEDVAALFRAEGVHFHLLCKGEGTAGRELLNYLGLEETEKDVVLGAMTAEQARVLLQKLQTRMQLKNPGRGIAFTVPVGSVGGTATLRYIAGEPGAERKECKLEQGKHDVIVAVVNAGFSDAVMDAAKSVRVRGGTVVHARGIGGAEAEKFFGVSIRPDKEILFMLVDREIKQDVMAEICKKAGLHSRAGTMLLSLPVSEAIGLAEEGTGGVGPEGQ